MQAGFNEQSLRDVVKTIQDETSWLLEIVNLNIENQQYTCTGDVNAPAHKILLFNLPLIRSSAPRPGHAHLSDEPSPKVAFFPASGPDPHQRRHDGLEAPAHHPRARGRRRTAPRHRRAVPQHLLTVRGPALSQPALTIHQARECGSETAHWEIHSEPHGDAV